LGSLVFKADFWADQEKKGNQYPIKFLNSGQIDAPSGSRQNEVDCATWQCCYGIAELVNW
jgi:hypothetical protein